MAKAKNKVDVPDNIIYSLAKEKKRLSEPARISFEKSGLMKANRLSNEDKVALLGALADLISKGTRTSFQNPELGYLYLRFITNVNDSTRKQNLKDIKNEYVRSCSVVSRLGEKPAKFSDWYIDWLGV